MSKIKCLVTGSSGFIFSNFIRKAIFEKKIFDFVSIDKITKPSVKNNFYINKSHQFYFGDIADDHFVNLIFELERPEIVINGAAESFVDDSLKDPYKFIHSNVMGTQVLVNASVKWGVQKFIQISTDECYGQLTSESDPLWTENSEINPRNPYSASKAAAELIVKAAHHSFGLNYNITRSSNNYGPRQTPEKFIPKVIKCINDNIPIPIYGQGLQMRDWLHVFDNCAAIMKIIENGKINETYNISANQEFSNIEVVNEICNIIGKGHSLISYVKDRPGHDFRYGINSAKVRSLGWEPSFKFKNGGLAQTVEWYQNNPWYLNN